MDVNLSILLHNKNIFKKENMQKAISIRYNNFSTDIKILNQELSLGWKVINSMTLTSNYDSGIVYILEKDESK